MDTESKSIFYETETPQASRELDELRRSGDYTAPFIVVRHALDVALRKALLKYFPFLAPVRVIETYMHASGESTEADVMSIKKFSDGQSAWTTLAKSANTAEAGWQSLVDGYEWRIEHERNKLRRTSANPRFSRR